METNNSNSELELMRQQIAEFKQQLDKQKIVNDRLIATSMKKKMSWIKKIVIGEAVLLPLILLMFISVKATFGLSWWSVGIFYALTLIDVWLDYRINIQCMSDADYNRNNLVNTIKKLLDMKRQRGIQMYIMVPACIVSSAGIGFDFCNSTIFASCSIEMKIIAAASTIGAVIGLILAYFLYRKMQNTNDELIRQIEELTEV